MSSRPSVLSVAVLGLLACSGEKDPSPASTGDESGALVDADSDGYASDVDCDDSDAGTWPGADELCDDKDNDCDGTTDEDDAIDALTCYTDADGDRYGAAASVACECGSGTSADGGDCDDSDADVYPARGEDGTDGIDNDCDGSIDEDCPDWTGIDESAVWTYDYEDPGTGFYSHPEYGTEDFAGTRDVTASFDSATETVTLEFSTTAYGRGYDGTTGRFESAAATYTCDEDGMSLVSYELTFLEMDWFDYVEVPGEQSCTFDPPVLIIPSDLEEGASWTTSDVSVECYIYQAWPTTSMTSTDTLDFTFTADAATTTGTWGDSLGITGETFELDGYQLELDFMADGAWVPGIGRVHDDKLDLTAFSGS